MSKSTALDIEAIRDIAERELCPYAGRHCLGTIFAVGQSFMAFDLADQHVTTVPKMQAAVAALSGPGAAHAG